MIHKLILKNFKKFEEEAFLFHDFDLIVGVNNSGKSTILQALAIWQFCVEQFRIKRKSGTNGIQIVLPNFTALPVPEFILLWNNKTERKYEGKNNLIPIYIEIDVYWKNSNGEEKNFCVQLRYQSPQALFARPLNGWAEFNEIDFIEEMPYIVYVPPFSGLEPHERWLAEGNVRQNVGKAQPGSVLRNLLYRVIDREGVSIKDNQDWQEIKTHINKWFGIELQVPEYDPVSSTEITVEYKANKKTFDIISGGSGFHQILTLLAFMYGYKQTTTILFDEPDAHLHINLQRQILNYLKQNTRTQILIATHSEEFIKNAELDSILSILSSKPERIQSSRAVIRAMSVVENMDVVRTQDSPYILYLEGNDDARILAEWANTLNKSDIYQKFYPHFLQGPTKKDMLNKAAEHYDALRTIIPELKRAILLDYDNDEVAINPPSDQPFLNEWKRKNIDNYLLVPQAWKRAVEKESNVHGLFLEPYSTIIDNFFAERGLILTNGSSWKNIKTPGFDLADGKKLLFENQDSLFEQIKNIDSTQLKINRSMVAAAMTYDEIHEDVVLFFDNLKAIVNQTIIESD
jgi:predicted ATPase